MANTRLSNSSGFTNNKHNSLLTGSQSSAINNLGMYGFEAIGTATPSGTNSVVFTSIPSSYQALHIRMVMRNGDAASNTGTGIKINGSTSSIYDIARMRSAFPAVTGDYSHSQTQWSIPGSTGSQSTSGLFGVFLLDIYNYSNPTLFTNARGYGGNDNYTTTTDASMIFQCAFMWRSRDVITQLEITQATAFTSGTRISLYGVK